MSEGGDAVSPEERAMGFCVMTLTYGGGGSGDLPLLAGRGVMRERVVALPLDDSRRLRRRHDGRGYVHERFDGERWRVVDEFADLRELASSTLWRTREAETAERERRQVEEEG